MNEIGSTIPRSEASGDEHDGSSDQGVLDVEMKEKQNGLKEKVVNTCWCWHICKGGKVWDSTLFGK
jgi:hypothetical protein